MELKFRAWHADAEKMITEGGYIQCHGNGQYLVFNEAEAEWLDKRCVIMQFTGLTDKHGNYVYDGDVLRHPAKTDWEKESYVGFEVFFHDGDAADRHIGWQFNRLHFYGNICGYSMYEQFIPKYVSQMEIVGNIYEHKHLLAA